MPAFESAAVEALRGAVRALSVGERDVSWRAAAAPASPAELADLLDGLVVGLGHLGRGATLGRHVAPTPRCGERPLPRAWLP
ncbi:hypothetical protein [Actinomycetospora aeridis]|uniref:Uncharacterized protein n=1 Tax=Actinomycetospora aeridis TaxID=3129231 RepID=A0ABU8N9H9_9PSEU